MKTLNNKFAIATSAYERNAKFVIIDSLGNLISTYTHIFPLNDLIVYHSIDNATDSGFIITGYIQINNTGRADLITVKTDKFGETIPPIGIINYSNLLQRYKSEIIAYPNPFNSKTLIKVKVNKKVDIDINIYNTLGQKITSLFTGSISSNFSIYFNPQLYLLASGVYFIKIKVTDKKNRFIETKKILYIKHSRFWSRIA